MATVIAFPKTWPLFVDSNFLSLVTITVLEFDLIMAHVYTCTTYPHITCPRSDRKELIDQQSRIFLFKLTTQEGQTNTYTINAC